MFARAATSRKRATRFGWRSSRAHDRARDGADQAVAGLAAELASVGLGITSSISFAADGPIARMRASRMMRAARTPFQAAVSGTATKGSQGADERAPHRPAYEHLHEEVRDADLRPRRGTRR